MPKRKLQQSTTPRNAAAQFTVCPEVGEAFDPDVTPIDRPTLVFGREHIYQTQYDLAELKRKLASQDSRPMPSTCVDLLRSTCMHLEGLLSADALQASLSKYTSEELDAIVGYCAQRRWLNSWPGVIQLTHDGVNALNQQLAFNAAAGRSDPLADSHRVELDMRCLTLCLDGKIHALTHEQARIVRRLADAKGGFVTTDELKKYSDSAEAPDKTINRLPPQVRKIIEGKRGIHGGRRLLHQVDVIDGAAPG